MADAKKPAAVYVTWGTFKNAIDQLCQGVPPNRLDRTVFPGMAWAVQNQLFTGLKFLGLTDTDNKPMPKLIELVGHQDEASRKKALGKILVDAYTDLFALDLKKTTPGELSAKMRDSYSVGGNTTEKAVRFFVNAVEYAGIPMSPLFAKTTTAAGPRTPRRPRAPRPKIVAKSNGDGTAIPVTGGTSKTVLLSSGGTLTLSASLDLFSLNFGDRKFVFELIDLLEEYEGKTLPIGGEEKRKEPAEAGS